MAGRHKFHVAIHSTPYLDQIRARATKISVDEGDEHTEDLKVVPM